MRCILNHFQKKIDNKYIIYQKPEIDEYDPLRAELDNFVNSILKKRKTHCRWYCSA